MKRWQIQVHLTCQGEHMASAIAFLDQCVFESMERASKGLDTSHALCLDAGPFSYHLGFVEVEVEDDTD